MSKGKQKTDWGGTLDEGVSKFKKGSGGAGHLNLPSGVELLYFDDDVDEVDLDFLPYVVSDTEHPDKNEDTGKATEGNLWYRRPYLLHRNIGADGGSYVCPSSIGMKCPICEYQKKLYKEGMDDQAKELYPKPRYLYNVIPLDSDKHEEKPYVWDMAESLFHEPLMKALNKNDKTKANYIFPDLEEGKTLEISFNWKSIGTKGKPFPETSHIVFKNREPYDDSILDEVADLDKVLTVLSYDELSRIFYANEEQETEPQQTTSRRSKKIEEPEEKEEPKRNSRSERTSARSKKVEEPKEKEEPEELTWATLESLSFRPLVRLCKEYELSLDVTSFDPDNTLEFAEAIADELGIEKPKKAAKATTGKAKQAKEEKSDNPCPSGYKFGADFAKYDACDDCEVYNECMNANRKKK